MLSKDFFINFIKAGVAHRSARNQCRESEMNSVSHIFDERLINLARMMEFQIQKPQWTLSLQLQSKKRSFYFYATIL